MAFVSDKDIALNFINTEYKKREQLDKKEGFRTSYANLRDTLFSIINPFLYVAHGAQGDFVRSDSIMYAVQSGNEMDEDQYLPVNERFKKIKERQYDKEKDVAQVMTQLRAMVNRKNQKITDFVTYYRNKDGKLGAVVNTQHESIRELQKEFYEDIVPTSKYPELYVDKDPLNIRSITGLDRMFEIILIDCGKAEILEERTAQARSKFNPQQLEYLKHAVNVAEFENNEDGFGRADAEKYRQNIIQAIENYTPSMENAPAVNMQESTPTQNAPSPTPTPQPEPTSPQNDAPEQTPEPEEIMIWESLNNNLINVKTLRNATEDRLANFRNGELSEMDLDIALSVTASQVRTRCRNMAILINEIVQAREFNGTKLNDEQISVYRNALSTLLETFNMSTKQPYKLNTLIGALEPAIELTRQLETKEKIVEKETIPVIEPKSNTDNLGPDRMKGLKLFAHKGFGIGKKLTSLVKDLKKKEADEKLTEEVTETTNKTEVTTPKKEDKKVTKSTKKETSAKTKETTTKKKEEPKKEITEKKIKTQKNTETKVDNEMKEEKKQESIWVDFRQAANSIRTAIESMTDKNPTPGKKVTVKQELTNAFKKLLKNNKTDLSMKQGETINSIIALLDGNFQQKRMVDKLERLEKELRDKAREIERKEKKKAKRAEKEAKTSKAEVKKVDKTPKAEKSEDKKEIVAEGKTPAQNSKNNVLNAFNSLREKVSPIFGKSEAKPNKEETLNTGLVVSEETVAKGQEKIIKTAEQENVEQDKTVPLVEDKTTPEPVVENVESVTTEPTLEEKVDKFEKEEDKKVEEETVKPVAEDNEEMKQLKAQLEEIDKKINALNNELEELKASEKYQSYLDEKSKLSDKSGELSASKSFYEDLIRHVNSEQANFRKDDYSEIADELNTNYSAKSVEGKISNSEALTIVKGWGTGIDFIRNVLSNLNNTKYPEIKEFANDQYSKILRGLRKRNNELESQAIEAEAKLDELETQDIVEVYKQKNKEINLVIVQKMNLEKQLKKLESEVQQSINVEPIKETIETFDEASIGLASEEPVPTQLETPVEPEATKKEQTEVTPTEEVVEEVAETPIEEKSEEVAEETPVEEVTEVVTETPVVDATEGMTEESVEEKTEEKVEETHIAEEENLEEAKNEVVNEAEKVEEKVEETPIAKVEEPVEEVTEEKEELEAEATEEVENEVTTEEVVETPGIEEEVENIIEDQSVEKDIPVADLISDIKTHIKKDEYVQAKEKLESLKGKLLDSSLKSYADAIIQTINNPEVEKISKRAKENCLETMKSIEQGLKTAEQILINEEKYRYDETYKQPVLRTINALVTGDLVFKDQYGRAKETLDKVLECGNWDTNNPDNPVGKLTKDHKKLINKILKELNKNKVKDGLNKKFGKDLNRVSENIQKIEGRLPKQPETIKEKTKEDTKQKTIEYYSDLLNKMKLNNHAKAGALRQLYGQFVREGANGKQSQMWKIYPYPELEMTPSQIVIKNKLKDQLDGLEKLNSGLELNKKELEEYEDNISKWKAYYPTAEEQRDQEWIDKADKMIPKVEGWVENLKNEIAQAEANISALETAIKSNLGLLVKDLENYDVEKGVSTVISEPVDAVLKNIETEKVAEVKAQKLAKIDEVRKSLEPKAFRGINIQSIDANVYGDGKMHWESTIATEKEAELLNAINEKIQEHDKVYREEIIKPREWKLEPNPYSEEYLKSGSSIEGFMPDINIDGMDTEDSKNGKTSADIREEISKLLDDLAKVVDPTIELTTDVAEAEETPTEENVEEEKVEEAEEPVAQTPAEKPTEQVEESTPVIEEEEEKVEEAAELTEKFGMGAVENPTEKTEENPIEEKAEKSVAEVDARIQEIKNKVMSIEDEVVAEKINYDQIKRKTNSIEVIDEKIEECEKLIYTLESGDIDEINTQISYTYPDLLEGVEGYVKLSGELKKISSNIEDLNQVIEANENRPNMQEQVQSDREKLDALYEEYSNKNDQLIEMMKGSKAIQSVKDKKQQLIDEKQQLIDEKAQLEELEKQHKQRIDELEAERTQLLEKESQIIEKELQLLEKESQLEKEYEEIAMKEEAIEEAKKEEPVEEKFEEPVVQETKEPVVQTPVEEPTEQVEETSVQIEELLNSVDKKKEQLQELRDKYLTYEGIADDLYEYGISQIKDDELFKELANENEGFIKKAQEMEKIEQEIVGLQTKLDYTNYQDDNTYNQDVEKLHSLRDDYEKSYDGIKEVIETKLDELEKEGAKLDEEIYNLETKIDELDPNKQEVAELDEGEQNKQYTEELRFDEKYKQPVRQTLFDLRNGYLWFNEHEQAKELLQQVKNSGNWDINNSENPVGKLNTEHVKLIDEILDALNNAKKGERIANKQSILVSLRNVEKECDKVVGRIPEEKSREKTVEDTKARMIDRFENILSALEDSSNSHARNNALYSLRHTLAVTKENSEWGVYLGYGYPNMSLTDNQKSLVDRLSTCFDELKDLKDESKTKKEQQIASIFGKLVTDLKNYNPELGTYSEGYKLELETEAEITEPVVEQQPEVKVEQPIVNETKEPVTETNELNVVNGLDISPKTSESTEIAEKVEQTEVTEEVVEEATETPTEETTEENVEEAETTPTEELKETAELEKPSVVDEILNKKRAINNYEALISAIDSRDPEQIANARIHVESSNEALKGYNLTRRNIEQTEILIQNVDFYIRTKGKNAKFEEKMVELQNALEESKNKLETILSTAKETLESEKKAIEQELVDLETPVDETEKETVTSTEEKKSPREHYESEKTRIDEEYKANNAEMKAITDERYKIEESIAEERNEIEECKLDLADLKLITDGKVNFSDVLTYLSEDSPAFDRIRGKVGEIVPKYNDLNNEIKWTIEGKLAYAEESKNIPDTDKKKQKELAKFDKHLAKLAQKAKKLTSSLNAEGIVNKVREDVNKEITDRNQEIENLEARREETISKWEALSEKGANILGEKVALEDNNPEFAPKQPVYDENFVGPMQQEFDEFTARMEVADALRAIEDNGPNYIGGIEFSSETPTMADEERIKAFYIAHKFSKGGKPMTLDQLNEVDSGAFKISYETAMEQANERIAKNEKAKLEHGDNFINVAHIDPFAVDDHEYNFEPEDKNETNKAETWERLNNQVKLIDEIFAKRFGDKSKNEPTEEKTDESAKTDELVDETVDEEVKNRFAELEKEVTELESEEKVDKTPVDEDGKDMGIPLGDDGRVPGDISHTISLGDPYTMSPTGDAKDSVGTYTYTPDPLSDLFATTGGGGSPLSEGIPLGTPHTPKPVIPPTARSPYTPPVVDVPTVPTTGGGAGGTGGSGGSGGGGSTTTSITPTSSSSRTPFRDTALYRKFRNNKLLDILEGHAPIPASIMAKSAKRVAEAMKSAGATTPSAAAHSAPPVVRPKTKEELFKKCGEEFTKLDADFKARGITDLTVDDDATKYRELRSTLMKDMFSVIDTEVNDTGFVPDARFADKASCVSDIERIMSTYNSLADDAEKAKYLEDLKAKETTGGLTLEEIEEYYFIYHFSRENIHAMDEADIVKLHALTKKTVDYKMVIDILDNSIMSSIKALDPTATASLLSSMTDPEAKALLTDLLTKYAPAVLAPASTATTPAPDPTTTPTTDMTLTTDIHPFTVAPERDERTPIIEERKPEEVRKPERLLNTQNINTVAIDAMWKDIYGALSTLEERNVFGEKQPYIGKTAMELLKIAADIDGASMTKEDTLNKAKEIILKLNENYYYAVVGTNEGNKKEAMQFAEEELAKLNLDGKDPRAVARIALYYTSQGKYNPNAGAENVEEKFDYRRDSYFYRGLKKSGLTFDIEMYEEKVRKQLLNKFGVNIIDTFDKVTVGQQVPVLIDGVSYMLTPVKTNHNVTLYLDNTGKIVEATGIELAEGGKDVIARRISYEEISQLKNIQKEKQIYDRMKTVESLKSSLGEGGMEL